MVPTLHSPSSTKKSFYYRPPVATLLPDTIIQLPLPSYCVLVCPSSLFIFFFFNDTAPTEIYPLPLHAALRISRPRAGAGRTSRGGRCAAPPALRAARPRAAPPGVRGGSRRTSRRSRPWRLRSPSLLHHDDAGLEHVVYALGHGDESPVRKQGYPSRIPQLASRRYRTSVHHRSATGIVQLPRRHLADELRRITHRVRRHRIGRDGSRQPERTDPRPPADPQVRPATQRFPDAASPAAPGP